MDENQDNLNSLKETILDEEKLVTYVSVSKELCVHVNISKLLLGQVVDEVRKLPNIELNVNFIISGLTEDNKARTTVCSEADLNSIRKTYKTVFFEHIYSVNKGKSLVENASFLAVNNFNDFLLCTGLIKNNQCVKRTSEEISGLIRNSQQSSVIEQKMVPLPQKKIKEENKDVNGHEKGIKIEEKLELTIKTEISLPKKDLANTKQKNGQKLQKGIAGFFNKPSNVSIKKAKQNSRKQTDGTIIKSEREEKIGGTPKEKKMQAGLKEDHMDVDDVAMENVSREDKNKKETSYTNKSKNKSLNEIKKNAKIDKKRKRVLHIPDSESEDENNDPLLTEATHENDSEDEIPPTPANNTVKITSGIINPNKRRKIVDKTYTDEEGYILTRKVEIYESCSENEEIDSNNKDIKETVQSNIKETHLETKDNVKDIRLKIQDSPNEKNSNKKISPPQKGKQTTLMSFFKKT